MTLTTPISPQSVLRVFARQSSEDDRATVSWNPTMERLRDASIEGGGFFLLCSQAGGGKSTFLRQFCRMMEKLSNGPVILGVLASPVNKSGWFLRFLADSLGMDHNQVIGSHGLLERLSEFDGDYARFVIAIDGLDLMDADVAVRDLTAFFGLMEQSLARVTIVATANRTACERIMSHDALAARYVELNEIPRLSDSELKDFLTDRLSRAGIFELFAPKLEEIIRIAAGIPGRALRIIVDQVSNAPPSSKADLSLEPKGKKMRSAPSKSEVAVASNKISIDDLLSARKPRRSK